MEESSKLIAIVYLIYYRMLKINLNSKAILKYSKKIKFG